MERGTSPQLADLIASRSDLSSGIEKASCSAKRSSFNQDHAVDALISPRLPSSTQGNITTNALSTTLPFPTSTETLNASSDYHSSESVHIFSENYRSEIHTG